MIRELQALDAEFRIENNNAGVRDVHVVEQEVIEYPSFSNLGGDPSTNPVELAFHSV